jgi:hypothetical protein
MDTENQQSGRADLLDASQQWVASFGAAPLVPADAADLVAGALKVTKAVSQAAHQLTWQTQDDFFCAMRRAEQADEC